MNLQIHFRLSAVAIVFCVPLSFLSLSCVFSSMNIQIHFRSSAVDNDVCVPLSFLSLFCVFFLK